MTTVNDREELIETLGPIGYHLYNLKTLKKTMEKSYY